MLYKYMMYPTGMLARSEVSDQKHRLNRPYKMVQNAAKKCFNSLPCRNLMEEGEKR